MSKLNRRVSEFGAILMTCAAMACGGTPEGAVLVADAQFDPMTIADILPTPGVSETSPAVAQTFTVLADGKFEEFWIVITDGPSADAGIIQITVRPVNALGEPESAPSTSIIDPILVDTSTLPVSSSEVFTEYFVGDDPGRVVVAGEVYAIVVEFVSRSTSTDAFEIAWIKGQVGNPFAQGTGSDGLVGGGFANNTNDYFFRTFVLQ